MSNSPIEFTTTAANKMLQKILKCSSLRLPHFKTPEHKRYYQLLNMKKSFTLIELIVVITIIAILMAILVPNFPMGPIGRSATKSDIIKIEMALIEYKSRNGEYPFHDRNDAINLSDSTDSEVKKIIIELLKIESFDTNENGVPIDYWENPIYYINKKDYNSSSMTASVPSLSEKVYYNPKTFQLVSGGPDGTKTSLGNAEDNVANYPKN